MSIIRVEKSKENPYVILNKTALYDPNLSYKAKGIFAYLMSKPDGWKCIVSDLIKHAKDGRDSVYAGLKELKENGYMIKRPIKDDKGKIIEWEEVIYEIPQEHVKEIYINQSKRKSKSVDNVNDVDNNFKNEEDSPLTENPDMDKKSKKPYTENPDMVKPDTGTPDAVNPEILLNNNSKNNDLLNNDKVSKENILPPPPKHENEIIDLYNELIKPLDTEQTEKLKSIIKQTGHEITKQAIIDAKKEGYTNFAYVQCLAFKYAEEKSKEKYIKNKK